jgi:hypothetical protein
LATDAGAEGGIGAALEGTSLTVPPAGATVLATAFVVIAGEHFLKHFWGDLGSTQSSSSGGYVCQATWQYFPAGTNTYGGRITGSHWTLTYTVCNGGKAGVQILDPCTSLSCAGWDSGMLTSDIAGYGWAGPSGMVHRGTLVDVFPTYCGGRSGCYVRILQAAAMTGAFTATTGWLDNGTSSACPSGNTCVTYPSLTAPATHVPATTTEVEADPDVAKCWIYHTIIHFDPQPGDPADPGDPVTTPGACSASVPSCYGMTVAACESAVAAAGGTVSFQRKHRVVCRPERRRRPRHRNFPGNTPARKWYGRDDHNESRE